MRVKTILGIAASTFLLACGAPAQYAGVDLGGPAVAGYISPLGGGAFQILGGGSDIWGTGDQCYYYYTWAGGKSGWSAKVHVTDLEGGTDNWSKIELMVRNSDPAIGPAADDAFVAYMVASSQNQAGLQLRATRGDSAADNGGYVNVGVAPWSPGYWLMISRTNNTFTLALSQDEVNWTNTYTINTAGDTVSGHTFAAFADPVTVGIAVTAHNNGNSGGVVASFDSLSGIPAIIPPTAIGAGVQVHSVTAVFGSEAQLTFIATNNGVPPVPAAYQWSRNGTAIPGATNTRHTFLAFENGAQYTCRATIPPPYNTTVDHFDSAIGTLTTTPATFYTNGLKQELFRNASRGDVEGGNTLMATYLSVTANQFESPNGQGDNYTARLSGWFIAPATTNYIFQLASDDDTDLFLSTDENPNNKRMIAQEYSWCGYLNWGNAADGTGPGPTGSQAGAADQKAQARSDMWTPDLNFPTYPFANGIPLSAGHLYYVEAVHHNGGGGDNLTVTYFFPATNIVVGELYTPSPTNGTHTAITNNVVLASYPATTLAWDTQPPSAASLFEGQKIKFHAAAHTDSEFAIRYQWFRNGTAVAGATTTELQWTAGRVAVDNGAQFYCNAQTQEGGFSINSTVCTLTVRAAVFEPGLAFLSHWWDTANPGGVTAVENGTAPDAVFTQAMSGFFAGPNGEENGDNYVNSIEGLFVAPSTANYVFFTCSDDNSDLFLSTDDTSQNKHLIAQETQWSGARNWVTAGGGDPAMKRSDTFTGTLWPTDQGGVPGVGATIHLNQGQKYYMQVVHHEGGSGDNVEVTYKLDTEADPVNGDASRMVGNVIGFNCPAASYMAFTTQPASQSLPSATSATLTAAGTSDSQIGIGITGSYQTGGGGNTGPGTFITLQRVFYQWYKNGTAIPGATTTTYTTPLLHPADNGNRYVCAIRALGIANWSNSQPAVLTVITDNVPPRVTSATIYTNTMQGVVYVSVAFNEMMDASTIGNLANFNVPGATITSVTVDTNDFTVVNLTITGTPTGPVTVTGVRDFSGNLIDPAHNSAAVGTLGLTLLDIGDPAQNGGNSNPAVPSDLWVEGPNAFTVRSEGSDIWDVGDGFSFLYETKPGNFDVVVRVKHVGHSSNWAKGGLMAREDLTPGSRNWNVVNDPVVSDGINAPDNSGLGANVVECNSRPATNGASADWGGTTGTGGRSSVPPAFPNGWVRLKRTGNVMDGYFSADAINWTPLGHQDSTAAGDNTPLAPTLFVGICTTGHNNDAPGADPLRFINNVEYADYNSSYIPPAPPAVVTFTNNHNGTVTISWAPPGGRLLGSPVLGATAAWTPVVPATNPVTLPASGTARYFRVVNP